MLLTASTAIVAQALMPLAALAEEPQNQISLADSIESEARKYLGLEYVWGGTTPAGFDCSGLMQFVFAKHGIKLPRTAAEQYRVGDHVATSELKKGDLVFFTTYKPGASHVGIYLGNGKMIDSNSSGLMISNFNSAYWQQRYLGAKRIFTETSDGIKYNTSISETNYIPSVQTVFELNDDGQTYTVQRNNSIIEIASHFDISIDELVQWNNLDSIGASLTVGKKLFVKKPQLTLTLFDASVVDETPPVVEEKSTADSIKERLLSKVNNTGVQEDEVTQPIVPLNVKETDFLPTKQFSISDDVLTMFEAKALTRAEVAVTLYHLEHVNPSFNQLFSERVKKQSIQDVTNEYWAKEAIDWAIHTGLLTVDNQKQFHPEQPFNQKAANTVMERLLDRYVITDSETKFIQEQTATETNWSLRYFQELTFNIADNLVALEKKTTKTTDDTNETLKKLSPSVKLASERMTHYMIAATTSLKSPK